MTSKERMLTALRREQPDRLPASVHQWLGYHLEKYMNGMTPLEAFRHFGLEAALAECPQIARESADWREEYVERVSADGDRVRQTIIHTPGGALSTTHEFRPTTVWCTEHLIKRPEDVELLKYRPVPLLDRDALARSYDALGDDGIMRGFVFGVQGGCWQDAVEYYGLKEMILAARRDPAWVHHFLGILQTQKLQWIEESLAGAKYDLIETGGGAASSTCISPKVFEAFCLPYDRAQHDAIHAVGLPAVYHTCGGMMPILELIAANHCDAAETLTPPGMGGDADAAELKRRLGGQVCLIGGINQNDTLDRGTRDDIRREVFELFATFGAGGGYIMSPSDHFFDTPPEALAAYAEAARECVY